MTHVYVTQSEQVVEKGRNDYRGVEKRVCASGGSDEGLFALFSVIL